MQRVQRDIPVAEIKPNPHNARTHSARQTKQIADSIRKFGFAAPVVVDENSVLIAGEGRWEAAKLLKLKRFQQSSSPACRRRGSEHCSSPTTSSRPAQDGTANDCRSNSRNSQISFRSKGLTSR